jgi:hypothetical protein
MTRSPTRAIHTSAAGGRAANAADSAAAIGISAQKSNTADDDEILSILALSSAFSLLHAGRYTLTVKPS